jgi:O-antigen/teichoic acid export membrane protein
MGNVLIQEVSRYPEKLLERWGKALITVVLSGVPLYALVVVTATIFLHRNVPPSVILSVAAADLFFARTLEIAGQAYQAMDRFARVAQLHMLPQATRFGAALVFAFAGSTASVETWALYYLLSTVLAAIVGVSLAIRELGAPRWQTRGLLADIGVGYHFSVSLAAQSVYNDIDKTMLARMASTAAVGTYAAAYRIIDVAFTPVRAMLFATYAQFFRRGVGGLAASASYARRLLPVACGYSVAAGFVILVAAPVVPWILGTDFQATSSTLRWLAALPLLKSLHYLGADALTGAGLQPVRSRIQVLVAAVNVAANLVLIPMYGWRGAAWASLVCDSLLAIVLWVVVVRLTRRLGDQSARPAAIRFEEA